MSEFDEALKERREHYIAAFEEAEQDLLTANGEITSLVGRRDRARRDLMVFREIEAALLKTMTDESRDGYLGADPDAARRVFERRMKTRFRTRRP